MAEYDVTITLKGFGINAEPSRREILSVLRKDLEGDGIKHYIEDTDDTVIDWTLTEYIQCNMCGKRFVAPDVPDTFMQGEDITAILCEECSGRVYQFIFHN